MEYIGGVIFVLTVIIQGAISAELCILKRRTFIQIPENTTVGSIVGYFDVVGTETQVELTPRPDANFRVNISSREITLTAPLDYETTTSYRVGVSCRQTNPTLEADLVQVIVVKDVNDNSPIFSQPSYRANVSELARVGSVIFKGISATDADTTNIYMQYEVVPGPYSDYVDFDRASVGDVTLKKSLDYESVQSFKVEIKTLDTPSDAAADRRFAVVNLTIDVFDEDDMNPAFSREHYDARIDSTAAGGTIINTVPKIFAEDQDLTNKSPVMYSIWEYGDSFAIDPSTGTVTLQKQLEKGIYTALLTASEVDNPRSQATATLTLLVSESGAQTRPPSFLKPKYDVMLLETTPINHILLNVQAVDPDFGSVLRYWVNDTVNGMFMITEKADILLLKPLDYESVKEYSFEVSVTDETYTSSVIVKIIVEDVNDNNPEILNPDVIVEAARAPDSMIAIIEASDKDSASRLSYFVLGHTDKFSVNGQGELFMTGTVDSFPETQYGITVLVQDNGSPPRQATAHVTVNLPRQDRSTEPPTKAAAIKEQPNDVLPIVLGIVAAVLLFVVIVLAIIIIRSRRKQQSANRDIQNDLRHTFKDENLDKAKAPSHLDPEGLAYRSTKPPGVFPSTLDLNFDDDHGETEDGATTIQHNPISSINHGYSGSDVSEVGRDMGDIRIQTSMTPYNNGFPNGTGNMKTFRNSGSSCESLSSDSTPGSRKQLVKPDLMEHGKQNGKPYAWNNLNDSTLGNSHGDLSVNEMKPAEEKPEITVYF